MQGDRAQGEGEHSEGERPEERRSPEAEKLGATAVELSYSLGRAPAEDARIAAVERLTELHAAGAISEEDFAREKRRLQKYG